MALFAASHLNGIRDEEGSGRLETLLALPHAPRVLVLTTFDMNEYVYEAMKSGASGFLLKRSSPERLIDAVRTVAAGDALLALATLGIKSVIEWRTARWAAPKGRNLNSLAL